MHESQIILAHYGRPVEVEVETLHRDEVSCTVRWRCPLEGAMVSVKAIEHGDGIKLIRLT